MTIYADTLAAAQTFTPTSYLARYLEEKQREADPPVPVAAQEVVAVHSLRQYLVNPTGGTFVVALNVPGVGPINAGGNFDTDAATLQNAVNGSGNANVPGWTNGDILVGGVPLTTGLLTFTFGGDSVKGHNPVAPILDGSSLTGGTLDDPTGDVTEAGQSQRNAWGVLLALGVILAPIPGTAAPDDPSAITKGPNFPKVPSEIILELAREATFGDGNQNTYFTIQGALFPHDRAPRVAPVNNLVP